MRVPQASGPRHFNGAGASEHPCGAVQVPRPQLPARLARPVRRTGSGLPTNSGGPRPAGPSPGRREGEEPLDALVLSRPATGVRPHPPRSSSPGLVRFLSLHSSLAPCPRRLLAIRSSVLLPAPVVLDRNTYGGVLSYLQECAACTTTARDRLKWHFSHCSICTSVLHMPLNFDPHTQPPQ